LLYEFKKDHFSSTSPSISTPYFLPLLIAALSGMGYRLGRNWFNIPKEKIHFLMDIHQGKYLGEQLMPIYVLLEGLGLILMLATGLVVFWNSLKVFRKKESQPNHSSKV
jgi:uncharacterized iron-regulated membrane protein